MAAADARRREVCVRRDGHVATRTEANTAGHFEVNLLNPGIYAAEAQAPGLKKTLRKGLDLKVGGRFDIGIRLEAGQLAASAVVTAAAPLLDLTTASGGRVMDQRQILELRFNSLNPLSLQDLAAGTHWTGTP